jgi:outer membrane protein assembly factor BamD
MHKTIQLIAFSLILVGFVSACKFNKIRKSTDIRKKYDAAIAYYEKKEYYKAALLLEDIIPYIRGTKESEIAQFYYAYCHYYMKQLSLASHYFKKFYDDFRNSQYAQESRYMHVRSLYEESAPYNLDQASTIDAINACQSFLNTFPNSIYFEECNKIIQELRIKLERKAFENANLYYRIRDFRAAVISFKNFQKGYPDSNYNEEAAYIKLLAQYNYAEKSTIRKKKDRYDEAIGYYEYLLDNFPESKYLKQSQKIYERCLNELNKLN